jgi:hypothetical protein
MITSRFGHVEGKRKREVPFFSEENARQLTKSHPRELCKLKTSQRFPAVAVGVVKLSVFVTE